MFILTINNIYLFIDIYFLINYHSDYSDDIYGLIEEIKRVKSKIQARKYQNLPFKFRLWLYVTNRFS